MDLKLSRIAAGFVAAAGAIVVGTSAAPAFAQSNDSVAVIDKTADEGDAHSHIKAYIEKVSPTVATVAKPGKVTLPSGTRVVYWPQNAKITFAYVASASSADPAHAQAGGNYSETVEFINSWPSEQRRHKDAVEVYDRATNEWSQTLYVRGGATYKLRVELGADTAAASKALLPKPSSVGAEAPLSSGAHGPLTGADLNLSSKTLLADQSINLPMVRIPDDELKRVYDKSGCNLGGFLDGLTHPINAKCRWLGDTRSATIVGIYGVNEDKETVLVVTNPTVYSEQENVRTDRGEGWGHLFLQAASVVLQGWAVEIAQQGLNLQTNLNSEIITNLKGGNFTLFGSLTCGSIIQGSTTSNNNTAICNINSALTGTAEGAGINYAAPGSPTYDINYRYSAPTPGG